ncbi:MAG TPA: hypothetical protein VFZ62_00685 [Candidatus Saccharimonadales bacterium]
MRKIKQLLIVAAVLVAGGVALTAEPAAAINVFEQCGANADSSVCQAQGTDNATSMIEIVVNTMIFLLGAIAVVMIVIGGIRYATSNGDSSSIKGAKDTILYAIIGLIVAILSYAIVNFVLDAF